MNSLILVQVNDIDLFFYDIFNFLSFSFNIFKCNLPNDFYLFYRT